MPAILFSSIFILIAAVPEIFGFQWPEGVIDLVMENLQLFDGVVGILVSTTTAVV